MISPHRGSYQYILIHYCMILACSDCIYIGFHDMSGNVDWM